MRAALLALLLAAAQAAAQQVVPPPLVPPEGPRPHDKPQGIYARIDVQGQQAMIARLRELIPTPRREAIDLALADPAQLSPPTFYALANAIALDDSQIERAVFWYHVGRIRAVFDALRCKDPSVRNVVNILGRNLNPDIARYQRQHRDRTLEIAKVALDWDRMNPRNYDYRWINLYGEVARKSDGSDPSELTVPDSEWPAILQRVHEAHLKSVQDFAAGVSNK